jgi:hypothetical protein
MAGMRGGVHWPTGAASRSLIAKYKEFIGIFRKLPLKSGIFFMGRTGRPGEVNN